MKGKNVLIILLAAILAGTIGYSLYSYFGPYKRVSEENQRLRAEIEVKRASESKLKEQISQLRATLEAIKAELAERTRLVENVERKSEGFSGGISQRPSMQEMRTGAVPERALGRVEQTLIRRAAITLRVENREPIGVSQRVSVDQQRVYCWMHVINGEGETIVVRWISKGQKVAETHLPIGSSSWRTWAYIALRPGMIGPVQVEIADENGRRLHTLPFEITD